MNDIEKYDPEDLEQLMRERQFEQLLDEEKAYVLRHMSGPEEYEQVRRTLLAVAAHMDDDGEIEPDPAIKQALMQNFAKEKKGGFTYWLNSVGAFLLPPERSFYARPAYQLAFAMIAVLIGVFFLYGPIDETSLALNEAPLEEKTEETVQKENVQENDGTLKEDFRAQEDQASADSEEVFAEMEQTEEFVSPLIQDEPIERELDVASIEMPEMIEDVEEEKDYKAIVEDDVELAEEERNLDKDVRKAEATIDGFTHDLAAKEDALSENEADISANGVGATVPAPVIIADSMNDEYLSYSAPVESHTGNAAQMEVTNQMVFDNQQLEEVQISTSRSKGKFKKERDAAKPALKSANMRQYSELIGLLHTTL